MSAEQDAVIKAAAVADYRPKHVAAEKTKKKDGDMAIELERTDDILAYLGAHRREAVSYTHLDVYKRQMGGYAAKLLIAVVEEREEGFAYKEFPSRLVHRESTRI